MHIEVDGSINNVSKFLLSLTKKENFIMIKNIELFKQRTDSENVMKIASNDTVKAIITCSAYLFIKDKEGFHKIITSNTNLEIEAGNHLIYLGKQLKI